jgi:hypothetical protein
MTAANLAALLEFARSDGRVCPMPDYWNRLWEMLPRLEPGGNRGWDAPVPLILGGWCASDSAKRERLIEHIQFAARHGVLDAVDRYLRELPDRAWYRVPNESR